MNLCSPNNSCYPYDIEKKLIVAILKDRPADINNNVDRYMYHLVQNYESDILIIKRKVNEFCILLQREMHDYIDVQKDLCYFAARRLEYLTTVKQIRAFMMFYIDELMGLKEASRLSNVKSIIVDAKNYMDSHYSQSLTLELVAHSVGVSPSYLSRLFTQYESINFVEYLTNQRIEKAKNLLHSSNISIGDIVYKVGYNSQAYFGQVFKKVTGVSASQYRKSAS